MTISLNTMHPTPRDPEGVRSFDNPNLRALYRLRCISCGQLLEPDFYTWFCPECGGLLEVLVEPANTPAWDRWRARNPGVWRYREALPPCRSPVTLGEGWTPLVRAERLGPRVWVKFEGSNPTGSFKDRGMTVGVSVAREAGARLVVAASTGNTSASLAAYAARAGLKSAVVLPKGKVAKGKLVQAVLHGAAVVEVEGSFDDALKAVLEASRSGGVYPLNSFNPWRLEGQKTLAYEVVEQLGGVPDYVFVPVGNGGNLAAIWKGFRELYEWGLIESLPSMVGVQAEGAAPLVEAWRRGLEEPRWVEEPETVATAIRIGRPVNWPKTLRAVRESRGFMLAVGDDEILEAQKGMARLAGLAVEPAAAAPLAGLKRAWEGGLIGEGDNVVLVATGHGLKDPEAAVAAGTIFLRANGALEASRILVSMGEGRG